MDRKLKEMQAMWQAQNVEVPDATILVKQLQKIDRRAKVERYIMLFTAPLTTLFLLWLLPVLESMYSLVAVVLIGSGMYMVLQQADKAKPGNLAKKLDFSNRSFIESQIGKLRQLILIASKYMWFYTGMLIAGINLGYIDALADYSMETRVTVHVSLSVTILFFMYFSIKKRLQKYGREIVPLIDRLESVRAQLANV